MQLFAAEHWSVGSKLTPISIGVITYQTYPTYQTHPT
jgi:hypothetical protein